MFIWTKTGILSDKEILGYLGKKIYIWPFKTENLKGSSYNLTASIFARASSNKKFLNINDRDEIEIPPSETALIETNESIFVEKDICGTYHSRVKLVSRGLSHIGTTLDPMFYGTSLIAVHNHSESIQKIKIGEPFVSLMFHKMSPSSKSKHDNQPGRSDIVELNVSLEDLENISEKGRKEDMRERIRKWLDEPWRNNSRQSLEDMVKEEVAKMDKENRTLWWTLIYYGIIPSVIFGLILQRLLKIEAFMQNSVYSVIALTALATFIFITCREIGNVHIRYMRGD